MPGFPLTVFKDSIIHTYFGDSDYSGLYYVKHLREVAQCEVMSQKESAFWQQKTVFWEPEKWPHL